MVNRHIFLCSICGKEKVSNRRGQNICSKKCRKIVKYTTKFQKTHSLCEICGWGLTIDKHHEGGKEHWFCPNHHALLTRGIMSLEELFNSKDKEKMIEKNKEKEEKEREKKENKLYYQILDAGFKEFTYEDLELFFGYPYEIAKKNIKLYKKTGKIQNGPWRRICISRTEYPPRYEVTETFMI